jgi:squalene-hopene/tetraprenyl-beta-curcumene cyclase
MILIALALSSLLQTSEPDPARRAIERSLPYLEREGVAWIKQRACLSCHHVPFLLWSFREARDRGFAVDEGKLAEWTEWARGESLGKSDGGSLDAMTAMLLAGTASADLVEVARARIDGLQQPDGSWKPGGGQLLALRRTPAEATDVTTMWTLFATGSSEKAVEFVRKAEAGATNEWLAARVAIEKRHGDPASFRKELLARQNADGGWAWLHGGASDAFATGQVLYALSLAGSMDADGVARARRFLIGSQGEDGSWAIDGLTAKPKPSKEPIYRYWGTAWAVIGLARTLP